MTEERNVRQKGLISKLCFSIFVTVLLVMGGIGVYGICTVVTDGVREVGSFNEVVNSVFTSRWGYILGLDKRTEFGLREEVHSNIFNVEVKGYKELYMEDTIINPIEGYKFILVDVSLKNTTEDTIAIKPGDNFKLQASDGRVYNVCEKLGVIDGLVDLDIELPKRTYTSGNLLFEVKESDTDFNLILSNDLTNRGDLKVVLK